MKWLLFFSIVFIGITANAMEKKALLGKNKKDNKQLAIIKERTAYANEFIGNIDKVLQKNGFTEKNQKAILKQISADLKATDVSSEKGLEGFFEYAQYATVVLKKLDAETDTYFEQVFCLGQLCVMTAQCNTKKADKLMKQQFALEQQKLQKLEDSVE